jgi:hypothetical protein
MRQEVAVEMMVVEGTIDSLCTVVVMEALEELHSHFHSHFHLVQARACTQVVEVSLLKETVAEEGQ